MKRIMAVTGSEADWGLLDAVLQQMLDHVHLTLVVIGGHEVGAIYEYSDNVDLVKSSGLAAYDMRSQAAHTASFCRWVFEQDRPLDAILLLGDRIEILTFAVAARLRRVPMHHLYAGDRSGCVDDYYRDAISALSDHLYAVSTPAYHRSWDFIHATEGRIKSADLVLPELIVDDGFLPSRKYAVARWHPETTTDEPVVEWINDAAYNASEKGVILYVLPPNTDDGWQEIDAALALAEARFPLHVKRINTLLRPQYLGLLKHAEWVEGNSSSFVLEAPMVGQKHIKVYGRRQQLRVSPSSDGTPMAEKILERIQE